MSNAANSIETQTTPDAAKRLRALAKKAGVTCLRIRKGTGCSRGGVSVQTKLDTPRADRVAAVAFLDGVCTRIIIGYSSNLWTKTVTESPELFASATVYAFNGS